MKLSFPGFFEIQVPACFILGVTLKRLRRVDNAVVAVAVLVAVLDVKPGTVLIISSGRILVSNCSLKARSVLQFFCNNYNWRLGAICVGCFTLKFDQIVTDFL